ncbi:hypothetical protein KUD94_12130 [Comamonas sp. NLF-1-9]|nr:hypothetical protein KUD94_12130 [Comamonas sp. NLF-1-9]
MLLFFSVARSATFGPAERADEAEQPGALASLAVQELCTYAQTGEKMPTDKLVDVSPMALRMSSPFNSSYWLVDAA